MVFFSAVIGLAAILMILYLLSLQGRRGFTDLKNFRDFYFAHRGLYTSDIPENSLAAFQNAVVHGYGAEFDVHLLADGGLGIMHDSDLERMTGQKGKIENLTTAQLQSYVLQGTQERIPTLQQVLKVFHGKTPLIIELKASNNAGALCEAVCRALEDYQGIYCLESFDPRCLIWLKKHRPDLIRGQLSEDYFKNPNSRLCTLLKFLLKYCMANFLGRPDFIAYEFQSRNNLSISLCRYFWKLPMVCWTVKNQEDFFLAKKENWIPIFEGFIPQQ